MFTTPKGHPQQERKLGKIIEISSPYSQGKEQYQNVVIEDSFGKWELKEQINHTSRNQWDLSGLSGAWWEDASEIAAKEIAYHQKDTSYFKNLFPNQLNPVNKETAKAILKPLTKDYLEREISFITDLEQMIKIYSKLMYSCPITLKQDDDNYTNADSKQSCYYVTKDTFEDIVYQPKLCWESRRNKSHGHKEHISHPRQILSDNRIEELQIAIILISEKISDAIDFGICGDEEAIDEIDYIELLKEAGKIRQRTIDLH
jgi:hypothetical protein